MRNVPFFYFSFTHARVSSCTLIHEAGFHSVMFSCSSRLCIVAVTLVPEVYFDFSPYERASREPRSGEKEKPLVTLVLNLTFMHTPGPDYRARIG